MEEPEKAPILFKWQRELDHHFSRYPEAQRHSQRAGVLLEFFKQRDPSETSNLSRKWSLQTKISNDFLTPKYSNKSKGKISLEDLRILHRTAMLPDRTDHVLSAGGKAEGGGVNFGSKTFRNRTGANGCNLQKAFVNSAGRSSSGCQINHKTSREIWSSHKQ